MGVLIVAAMFQMAGIACAVVAWRCLCRSKDGSDLGQSYAAAVGVFAIANGLLMTLVAWMWMLLLAGRL